MSNQEVPGYAVAVAAKKRKKGRWGGLRPGAGRKSSLQDPVSVTADLERADIEALQVIATRRGSSVAALLRTAVSAYLSRQSRRNRS